MTDGAPLQRRDRAPTAAAEAAPPLTRAWREAAGFVERSRIGATALTAGLVAAVALLVYVLTLLPGVSFGDWAEMQLVVPRLDVPHPSGFPLYVLLGYPFTLLPVESVAWRMNLFSAVAAALACGVAVLIAGRLGVRPTVAGPAALALAFTGTLWQEATFAEMNALHLLLLALLLHRVLVWRDERRDRDLLVAALLGGLSLSNHLLAATAVPFVAVLLAVQARRRFVRRPLILPSAAGLFLLGLSPYLFIPVRARFGPPEQYASLLTWEGFRALVTGEQFRSEMKLTSADAVAATLAAVPDVVAHLADRSHAVVLPLALLGALVILRRHPAVGVLMAALAAANVHVYVNYFGNLDHYLLLTWLIVMVALAVAVEQLARGFIRRFGRDLRGVELTLLLLPVTLLAGGWAGHDQSSNRLGERFAETVFDAVPHEAVLVTYWDALTTLSYAHCVEGTRPDVVLVSLDPAARVTCDRHPGSLEEVARERPVYALFVHRAPVQRLAERFRPIPERRITLPYGQRYPEFERPLYRLVPRA